jgi:hypothetical protein
MHKDSGVRFQGAIRFNTIVISKQGEIVLLDWSMQTNQVDTKSTYGPYGRLNYSGKAQSSLGLDFNAIMWVLADCLAIQRNKSALPSDLYKDLLDQGRELGI